VSGRYRIHFRWHGKQQKRSLGKVSAEEAASQAAQVDYLLMRLKQRLIELPPGVNIVEFVQFDYKPPADLQEVSTESRELALAGFRDRYLATRIESLEDRTIEGIGLHFKHLIAALGERFPFRQLKLADLQGYVDRRTKAKGARLLPGTDGACLVAALKDVTVFAASISRQNRTSGGNELRGNLGTREGRPGPARPRQHRRG